MYFHTDSPQDAQYIAMVAAIAAQNGQRLRLDVDEHGNLRVKRGEGMWTPPMAGTPDPYRDQSNEVPSVKMAFDLAGREFPNDGQKYAGFVKP